METIKIIDEKTIERNGIKYVPEKAEKPEFKVGQWVISDNAQPRTPARVLKIDGVYLTFDNYCGHQDSLAYRDWMRPATKEEIEAHLRKICEEKGYKAGVKIRNMINAERHTIKRADFTYYMNDDSLHCSTPEEEWRHREHSNPAIYYQGEFAEVIPDKKPKPVTRKDFEEFLAAYEGNYFNGFAMSSFLNDYLF